jgi:hypothetical protein
LDFEAVEVAARRTALRIAAMVVAKRLNTDHGDAAPLRCGHCESAVRDVGRRSKTFTTVVSARIDARHR